MCDEIVKSINFELQKAITDQQSSFAQEISELKKSLYYRIQRFHPLKTHLIAVSRATMYQYLMVSHLIIISVTFLSEEARDGLESFVNQNTANFTDINKREVVYFGKFSYKYDKTEHKPAPMPDVIHVW